MSGVIYSCPTLRGPLLTALQAAGNPSPVYFLPQALHSDPQKLHAYLQERLDNLFNAERVVLCVSGCGGAAVGLVARNAELIVPRTRDCIDLLLSGDDYRTVPRIRRVYMTEDWLRHMENSDISLPKLTAAKGEEEAKAFLQKLYRGFEEFIVIDTGTNDVAAILAGLAPYLEAIGGHAKVVKGEHRIIKELAEEKYGHNFLRIKKGETVPAGFYPPNPGPEA